MARRGGWSSASTHLHPPPALAPPPRVEGARRWCREVWWLSSTSTCRGRSLVVSGRDATHRAVLGAVPTRPEKSAIGLDLARQSDTTSEMKNPSSHIVPGRLVSGHLGLGPDDPFGILYARCSPLPLALPHAGSGPCFRQPHTDARRLAGHPAPACTTTRRLWDAARMSPGENSISSYGQPPSALASQMQSCIVPSLWYARTPLGADCSRGRARIDDGGHPCNGARAHGRRHPVRWILSGRPKVGVRWVSRPRPVGAARQSLSGRLVMLVRRSSPR
jgi:hypothetical protein